MFKSKLCKIAVNKTGFIILKCLNLKMDTLSNHHSIHRLVATTLSSSEILYFQDGELLG